MKRTEFQIVLLTGMFLLLTIQSCKKQDEQKCTGIFCENGGTCLDGQCVCTSNFTGNRCQTPKDSCQNINCGPHGYCINGQCQCDPNWRGTNCSQQVSPIDTFLGLYHVVGSWHTTSSNAPIQSGTIDDTVEIVKVNDTTLTINSFVSYRYDNGYWDTSRYNYVWLAPAANYGILSFNTNLDDSVFYHSNVDATVTNMKGAKIK